MPKPCEAYEGIIVLGFPRSGTTLLRRLLNAHPSIVCPPETNLLNAAARYLEEIPFGDGLSSGVLPGLQFCGLPEEEILTNLRNFTFSVLSKIAEHAGKARWAEKTAFSVFHINQIERLFGKHCRFICLFRHPLDVICSVKELCDEMGTYLPELHQYICRNPEPLSAFAQAWAEVNDRLYQFIGNHPENTIQLLYEDLVGNPVKQLHRIFRFLDAPADPQEITKSALANLADVGLGDWKTYETSKIASTSVNRWSRQLTDSTARRLGSALNPLMSALGYDPIPSPDLDAVSQPQRRYQLERMVARMCAQQLQTEKGV